MESQDFEFEEFQVAEAIGLALHGLDLVVGALQGSGGYGVIIVSQDPKTMQGHSLGEFMEHGDSGSLGSGDPVCQKGGGRGFVGLFPDLS